MALLGSKHTVHAQYQNRERGLTLIELMVAIVISTIIIAAIYQTFSSQQRSYFGQNDAVEMQQNLRAGMALLSREIRMAGYKEEVWSRANAGLKAGFVAQFDAPNDSFLINYLTDRDRLAFTLDRNGNAIFDVNDVDNNGDLVVDVNDAEQIAYRYNTTDRTLERFDAQGSGGQWDPLIENVDAVDFGYVDSGGLPTTNPAQIAFVEVSLLIRGKRRSKDPIDTHTYTNKDGDNICPPCDPHYRRRFLRTTIQVRNGP